ncbi:hypothetical protein Pelo_946 [Pelomyxa schiedti]|nr:hypothetical protein Pelo_946 [Pelomyxa schiedti]
MYHDAPTRPSTTTVGAAAAAAHGGEDRGNTTTTPPLRTGDGTAFVVVPPPPPPLGPLKRTDAPFHLWRSPKRPRVATTALVVPPGAASSARVAKRKLAPKRRQHGRWVRTNVKAPDKIKIDAPTETTHKVELSLAEQLLAFACASHPTCGARSAAALMWRHDGLPANLRRVIAESDLFFAVCVTAPKFRVFHFGISPLTLGVSVEPREISVKHMQCRNAAFAGQSNICFVKKELLGHLCARFSLVDVMTGRKEILLPSTHSYTRYAANHAWWVCYDFQGKVLHVANLLERRYARCPSGDIDVPEHTGAFMYLSKMNRNEAVLCVERGELSGKLCIFVIDVEQSFHQGSSVIARQTCCQIPAGQAYGSSLLISGLGSPYGNSRQRTRSCTNDSFIILRTKYADLVTGGDLFHVVEARTTSSSECRQLSSDVTALAQVDCHRFCISKQDRYEIWGFTVGGGGGEGGAVEEPTPHRLKEITCFLPLEPLTTVFAEAGFLFKVRRGDNSIETTPGSSPSPKWSDHHTIPLWFSG